MPNDNNTQRTTQQKRAAYAYKQVEGLQKAGEKIHKEYSSLARGFPAMIQIDGLGSALAFLLAKAGGDKQSAHRFLYDHVSAWLESNRHTSGDLLQSILQLDSARYRQIASEIQAYMVWIKRFVEAEVYKAKPNG